jgi:putative membrane protein
VSPSVHSKAENGSFEIVYIVFAVLSTGYGFIHWKVTRWKIDGDTLRIETGLIRKDSRRLPLARIQAVDVVQPMAARLLGVSELRIRLAGSGSTDGKLAYLSERGPSALRGRLLGGGHEPDAITFEQADRSPWPCVPTGRLIGSVLLSLVSIILIGTVLTLLVLDEVAPKTAAAATGFLAAYLLSFASVVWRRLSGQYHFEAVERRTGAHPARPAPDGVRDHPAGPDPGRAPGAAAAVASAGLVPARGRHRRVRPAASSGARAPAWSARRSSPWARARTPGTWSCD